MTKQKRIALILEFIFGFAIVFAFWLLGLFVSPFIVIEIFSKASYDNAILLFCILGGGIGLYGVVQLFLKVINPKRQSLSMLKIKSFVCVGIGVLLLFGVYFQIYNSLYGLVLVILPVCITIHFLYLAGERIF